MILLDTCAIIWDALDTNRLSPEAKNAIERNERELIICDISIWEIAMLIALSLMLRLPDLSICYSTHEITLFRK